MSINEINRFLNKYNYDVRLSGDARWIDQKCTFDVLSVIADSILEYVKEDKKEHYFTVRNIWDSEYSREFVTTLFSKPDPATKADNEYDKYFGQPIKLLAYSKILESEKIGNKYIYYVKNMELLKFIALRPTNALLFLNLYIQKVLKDSDIWKEFECFFQLQDTSSFFLLKKAFSNFTIRYTKITKELECNRIFTKVLNPLAYSLVKKGTIRGRLSKDVIKLSDLAYNRDNWRDELSGKLKADTRKEHESAVNRKKDGWNKYAINKAKKDLKAYNDTFFNGKSEVKQCSETGAATQAHHIFPQSEFPSIASYLENLIMLTPNQHYLMAHPENYTSYIDKRYQYVCLIAKMASIMKNIQGSGCQKMYSFDDYKKVLNEGLKTKVFDSVNENDFATVLNLVDKAYSDVKDNSKYQDCVQQNYPRIN